MTELALDTPLAPEQREYLELVRFSSNSLMGIINDILDFSKIESDNIALEKIDFSIRELLASLLKALAVKAAEKSIELVYKIDPALPMVLIGDPGRLRQIITNLIGNAIKFSESGEVVLDVQLVHQHEGCVEVYFAVTDHGIGIPKDKQASIFNPFSQADASTTRKYGGTGLGLTISSRLVQRMHGMLEVSSEPGNGSTFYFTIRFETGPENVVLPSPVDISGLSVLVVDDNAINRHFFADTLKSWKMHPVTATSGAEAFEYIHQAERQGKLFDLILLDICMPGMDGFELATRLQLEQHGFRQKIIMLSSAGAHDDARRCRQMGVHDYVSKPVSQAELFQSIVAVMSGTERRAISYSGNAESVNEDLQSLQILVVEDNTVNQQLVKSLLRKWGHQSVLAENGLIALEKIAHQNFDVILMDMQMPLMGGIEATQRIRAYEEESQLGIRVPIIAMTANAMPGDWERCMDAGMDHYLSKPVKSELLKEMLHKYQKTRRLNMENIATNTSAEMAQDNQAEPLFDYHQALQSADWEIVKIIGQSFLDACDPHLAEIDDAINRQDAELLHRSAHTMKGLVGNFYAQPVERLAQQLEIKGKNRDFSQVREIQEQMVKEIHLMNQALKNFLTYHAE